MSQNTGPNNQRKAIDELERSSKRVCAPKKRKKKKSKQQKHDESAWTPAYGRRANRKGKKTYDKPKAPIAQLNGILTSPSKKVKIVTKHRLNLIGAVSQAQLAAFALNTPNKGVRTTSLVSDDAILLRARTIETDRGPISIFLSENKVDHAKVLDIPKVPDNLDKLLDELGMPKTAGIHSEELEITHKQIQKVKRIKRERATARVPSNKQVMKVSANVVAKALGFDVEGWQWWHGKGHSLFGDDMQRVDNFYLGMHHGNAKMNDLAESLIESLLKDQRTADKVYLATDAEFVPGFERARLCSKITWTIKDGPGEDYTRMVQYEFNPLSTDTLSQSEIDAFKQILVAMFFDDEHSPIKVISPYKGEMQLQSPTKAKKQKPCCGHVKPITFKFDDIKDEENQFNQEITEDVESDEKLNPISPIQPNI